METQIKRYNILLRGKVQHIGYRGIIEGIARKLDIRGYVFNDVDGSVKIACEGIQKSIDGFINGIKEFARSDIESIEKKEIYEELYLPSVFSRVATDEYYEFSKKFDIGIDILEGIKIDTGEMKFTLGEMKNSLYNIDSTLGTFVNEQKEYNQWMKEHMIKTDEHNQWMKEHVIKTDEHNQWMKEHMIKTDEHNQRLGKILEKLTQR